MTRTEAIEQGLKTYEGKPHSCGSTLKYTKNAGCVRCLLDRAKNAEYQRGIQLRTKFGITKVEYDLLLSKQHNKCAICGMYWDKNQKQFSVDHNHQTGKIRGILCMACNLGIGQFKENLELLKLACKYLENSDA